MNGGAPVRVGSRNTFVGNSPRMSVALTAAVSPDCSGQAVLRASMPASIPASATLNALTSLRSVSVPVMADRVM